MFWYAFFLNPGTIIKKKIIAEKSHLLNKSGLIKVNSNVSLIVSKSKGLISTI